MKLDEVRRYPVKGVGWEPLDSAVLSAGAPLPGDRAWALAHADSPHRDGWAPKAYFLQGARGPRLMAVTARSDGPRLTLRHPDRPEASFELPADGAALLDWVAPLWPDDLPPPVRLVAAPPESLSDTQDAWLHVITRASLEALAAAAGHPIDPARFRANLILSDSEPFAELGWVGRRLRVGGAEVEVTERTGRCRATEANPVSGARDLDVVKLLRRHFGHTDFGIYVRVLRGGAIAPGDSVELA